MEDRLESARRLGDAFEGAAVGMVIKDAGGRVLRANPAFREMLGYGEGELAGMPRADFTHPGDAGEDAGLYSGLFRGERKGFRLEKRYAKKGGGTVWGRLSVSLIEGAGGRPLALGVVEDISGLKEAEAAVRASEARFRAVVEQSPLAVHVFAPDGRSIRANGAWNDLWYLGGGEEPEGSNVFEDEQLRAAGLLPYAKDGAAGVGARIPALFFDPARAGREGEPRWLEGVVYPLRDASGGVAEVTIMLDDVTERKRLEEQLAHRALHDPLTGLPNRALLLDRIGQALARLGQRSGVRPDRGSDLEPGAEGVAVLFFDLDGLKRVNDSLGHEAGDELLVAFARRLGGSLRPADTLARLAGDEFVVLLEGAGEEAVRAAERIVQGASEAPFAVAGQEVFVTVSVGVALGEAPGDGAQPAAPDAGADVLLRHADLAMYEAKRRGGARHALYEERMGREAGARLELEGELRRALARGEIEAFYQPEVSLESGRVVAVEALARWRHPQRGLLLPAEFIPLAEETGLIVELGYRVLRVALGQAARWRENWGGPPGSAPPVVWVNLSARQFREPDLAAKVSAILAETGVEPGALGLEVTESILVEDAGPSVSLLEDLRRLGVGLAVDDFGTGYSSLGYLTRLPVGYLKIDRSFVSGLGPEDGPDATGEAEDRSAGDATIVSAVIGLARSMGMKVVAEGVETGGQLARLEEMGCDLAQGYRFARPLPAGEATAYLADGRG